MLNEIMTNSNGLTIETLQKFEETFIDYIDSDELTLKAYKCGIDKFINYLKNNNIKQPTRNDIIAFRDYLRANYSSNTTNSYMVSIKALFRYLSIHKLYENIAIDIKGARYDTTPKKQVLSLEQVKNIYSNLTNLEEKCLFGLMVTTGLRSCEVASALIEDIKIYNGEYVLFVLGKKRDDKSDYVKLSEQVLNDIKAYIGDRTSGYIFVSTSNNNKGNGVTTKTLRLKIKNIFKKFGIEEDTFSCHSLRRTSGTLMYELGQSVYDIQQVLRHKSTNTTTRYINSVVRNNNKSEYMVSNAIFG